MDAKAVKKGVIRFPCSEDLWSRAVKVIPSGTQTLSKGPDQFVRGVTPKYLERGEGSHVWDVDGNEYIDYPMALGPILLGYNYPPVVEAVTARIRRGTTFTLMHPLEVEVAELLASVVPCCEMVRFAKNGADVTSAAVRAARAYTGREHIAYCGYHGCQDWYAVTTPRNKGIPSVLNDLMHPFEYNDIASLEKVLASHPGEIACVMMEVPGTEPLVDAETGRNFLQMAMDAAHRHGALFILDEIVTGFRFALGGAQELYDLTPDLACFGKGMANGFPISAVVGKREFMKEFDEVFFSMTYSGDTIGLAAAKATIEELLKRPVLEHIWETGRRLHEGINSVCRELDVPFRIAGQPVRGHFEVDLEDEETAFTVKSLFLQETVKRGVLFGGPVFISYSHDDDDVKRTVDAAGEALVLVREAIESGNPDRYLEGEKIGVVFRQRK